MPGRVFRRPGGEFLSGCPERNQRGTRGQAQMSAGALIFARPLDPHLRGPQLGGPGSRRKGAGSSVERLPLVFRCRSSGGNRKLGTPLFDSAFVAVGLKYGSGEWRIREPLHFSRRARCPHRAVPGRPGVPPLRHFFSPPKAARPGGRALRPSTSRHLLGQTRRSRGTAPAEIFANLGPSGPSGIAEATQILRAVNSAKSSRYASPVMGSGERRL